MTRREGLAVLRQHAGINREEHQELVLLQGIDERPLGELQAYRHGPAGKALAQRASPFLDRLRAMRQDGKLPFFIVGNLQTNVVFSIGPIDADEGGKFRVWLWLHDSSPKC